MADRASPQSVIGNLTWNPNGTLQQLAITDPFNASNQQTCNYGYDDLTRLSSVSCGSAWSQSFGYPDAFGNLTKSGSASWQPSNDPATNRMSSIPSFTCPGSPANCYDANGNTIADGSHTYAWDARGHPITIDGVGLTYDALGRMVEQNRSGSYTQILYGPGGGKLVLMNGQTVSKAFIPLPAGATAVYTSGPTLSYFRHPDWLGSSRFGSTPSRTMYSDLAYAPFGETYAEAGTPDRSFTGQNQDTVPDYTAGLYDFLFREYAQYGRWISPDPAGTGAVNPANPQSWNRYAYVLNNPLIFVDPLGLVCSLVTNGSGDQAIICSDTTVNVNGDDGTVTYNSTSATLGNPWVGSANAGYRPFLNDPLRGSVVSQNPPVVAAIGADPGAKSAFCMRQAAKAAGQDLIGFDIADYAVSQSGQFCDGKWWAGSFA